MHALLIPAFLLLASLSQRKTASPSAAPKPLSPPGGAPRARVQATRRPTDRRAMPASQAAPARRTEVQHAPEHPDVIPAPPEAQAAVDAAMADLVKKLEQREMQAPQPTGPGTSSVSRTPYNVPAPASVLRDPFVPTPPTEADPIRPATSVTDMLAMQKQAAKDLLAYVLKTRNFGTEKQRPPEIVRLQQQMGMQLEPREAGILGPKTRARAKELGVAIPRSPNPVPKTKR